MLMQRLSVVVTLAVFLRYGFTDEEIGHRALLALVPLAPLVLAILQWMFASSARCAICRARPLYSERCAYHRTYHQSFFKPRLVVAMSVVFRNRFRCPYCGEENDLSKALRTRTARRR